MDKKTMQLWVEYVEEIQSQNSKTLAAFNKDKRAKARDYVQEHKERFEKNNKRNIAIYERALKDWNSKGFFFKLFNQRPMPPRIENHKDHWIVTPVSCFSRIMPFLETPSWEGFVSWCAKRYKITPHVKK